MIEPGQLGPTLLWRIMLIPSLPPPSMEEICKTVAYFQNVETSLYRHVSTFSFYAEKYHILNVETSLYRHVFTFLAETEKGSLS